MSIVFVMYGTKRENGRLESDLLCEIFWLSFRISEHSSNVLLTFSYHYKDVWLKFYFNFFEDLSFSVVKYFFEEFLKKIWVHLEQKILKINKIDIKRNKIHWKWYGKSKIGWKPIERGKINKFIENTSKISKFIWKQYRKQKWWKI